MSYMCPKCMADTSVRETRAEVRQRKCRGCGYLFYTEEMEIEKPTPYQLRHRNRKDYQREYSRRNREKARRQGAEVATQLDLPFYASADRIRQEVRGLPDMLSGTICSDRDEGQGEASIASTVEGPGRGARLRGAELRNQWY